MYWMVGVVRVVRVGAGCKYGGSDKDGRAIQAGQGRDTDRVAWVFP